jgi:hypothetical protein
MYGLPKVHKDPKSWAIPMILPKIRPILAGVNSHTYFFEKVMSSILQPIADNLEFSLSSSLDIKSLLLNLKSSDASANFMITTLDVESLYPSIPIQEGIEFVGNQIDKWYSNKLNQLVITSMQNLLSILLKNNTLKFDNKYYIQNCGTAMGMAFAPAYANIFLDQIDIKANDHPLAPILYTRYLDDILCIYQHSEIEFQQYYQYLNNINPAIKFTVEKLSKKVNYLDLSIDITDIKFPKFTLYQKNSSINNMVDFASGHSINILLATIQGYIHKIYTYNNNIVDIKDQLKNLESKLHDKHYPDYFFNNQLDLVQKRLLINESNNLIIGKIKCYSEGCDYCKCISNNRIIHCNLYKNLIISQNYNCSVKNFTFIIQCKCCDQKIISHFQFEFKKFIAKCIYNFNQNKTFLNITQHFRSHVYINKFNTHNIHEYLHIHIIKHFPLKKDIDLSQFIKLKNNTPLNSKFSWDNLPSKNFDKVHYITHSHELEEIILTIRRKYKIKNINTYTNYKNQLKNILTQKLKRL